jgi:hypothetical protein
MSFVVLVGAPVALLAVSAALVAWTVKTAKVPKAWRRHA